MVFLINQEHSCRRLITHASKHTWEFLGSREECEKRKGNECLRLKAFTGGKNRAGRRLLDCVLEGNILKGCQGVT